MGVRISPVARDRRVTISSCPAIRRSLRAIGHGSAGCPEDNLNKCGAIWVEGNDLAPRGLSDGTVGQRQPPAHGRRGPRLVGEVEHTPSPPWHRRTTVIAALSVAAIVAHLALRFGFLATPTTSQIPLLITLRDRRRAPLGPPAEAPEAGIRFGFARRYFHHHVGPAGRVPGGLHHCVDARGRRSAGELRITTLLAVGRHGSANAGSISQSAWAIHGGRGRSAATGSGVPADAAEWRHRQLGPGPPRSR
jgi:hypothetical protein